MLRTRVPGSPTACTTGARGLPQPGPRARTLTGPCAPGSPGDWQVISAAGWGPLAPPLTPSPPGPRSQAHAGPARLSHSLRLPGFWSLLQNQSISRHHCLTGFPDVAVSIKNNRRPRPAPPPWPVTVSLAHHTQPPGAPAGTQAPKGRGAQLPPDTAAVDADERTSQPRSSAASRGCRPRVAFGIAHSLERMTVPGSAGA